MRRPYMPFFRLDQNNVALPCRADQVKYGVPVGKSNVNGCFVSTVFLGINHRFGPGDPVLFETMIFTKRKGNFRKLDQAMQRYCTYLDAQKGHNAVVQAIKHKRLSGLRRDLSLFWQWH